MDAFVETRPAILEAEAVGRAIAMAQVAGCPLYIPHVSARLALDEIAAAKSHGFSVFGETCPQYLTLTNDDLAKRGPLLKIGPPLRTDEDRSALWRGLADGVLDCVASDHAPKEKTIDDEFSTAPYGSPQLETMLPLLFDEGVVEDRLGLSRLVEVTSEAPARIFGLYPRKGALEVGSDADLVIVDPDASWTIERATQHSNAPYSAYEGRAIRGRPILTMRRGEVLVEGGEQKGRPGRGRFLRTEAGRTRSDRRIGRG
jgi:dihydropyrimidinase